MHTMQTRIESLIANLKASQDITELQAQRALESLKDKALMTGLQNMLAGVDSQGIVKLFVDAHYSGSQGQERQPESASVGKQTKLLKTASICRRVEQCPPSRIIQSFSDFFAEFKLKYQASIRLLAEMVCKQSGKAIHSNISKLLELLMNTAAFSYFKHSESSSKQKVEFYNSSTNYLTIYIQNESRFKDIWRMTSSLEEGIFDSSDVTLCQLFGIEGQKNLIFMVEGSPSDRVVFKVEQDGQWLAELFKAEPSLVQTYSVFLQRIIQTLHRSKFQNSNVQYAVKSMIDILEISLKINSIAGQQRLLASVNETSEKPYKSFVQFVQESKQTNPESEQIRMIQEMSEEFTKVLAKYQSRLDVYQNQLSDNSSVFMDFNQFGQLKFISNRLPSIQFNRLKANLSKKSETIKIQDIFKENSDVLRLFGQASKGDVSNDPAHFHEDGYPGEVTFAYNSQRQLIRVHVNIYLRQTKKAQGSYKGFLSNNSIVSSDSQKDVNKRIKESTGINNSAKKRLIDIKESQTPGVTKFGWLELFVKNDVIDKYKRKNIKSHMLIKEDNDQQRKQDVSNSGADLASDSLFPVSLQLLDPIDIEDFDLNLLEVDLGIRLPFVQKVFRRVGYFNHTVDTAKFQNFMYEIQQKYEKHNNPFHNLVHGLNVMHYCYLFSKLPEASQVLGELQTFALVLSGLCHDVGHRGFNNSFQVATLSKKAIIWNDKSPLQNYHASTTFKILLKAGNNFLEKARRDHFIQIRKSIIANILATDIKEHFPMVTNFQNKLKTGNGFQKSPADMQLLSTFIIHSSDFSGAVKNFEVSQQWSRRCNSEFSNQYRQQGVLGITQTPFMKDLDKEGVIAKNETGFLKVIVRPLYKCLCDFFVDADKVKRVLNNIDQTVLIWQKEIDSKGVPTENKTAKESN